MVVAKNGKKCNLYVRAGFKADFCQGVRLCRFLTRSINGVAQTMTYDSLGRVSSVVNALGTFNYGYQNDSNRMTSMSIPNGEQVKATYLGAAGDFRLSQIQNLQSATSGGANISTFGHSFNPEGTIATWSQALGTGAAVNYTLGYDNTDELTSGTATGSSYGYTYDAGGNRLSETINGATRTAVYNAANQLQQLTPAKSGDKTYQWDAENRLVGINYTGTNQSTQMKYDGFGRCVEIQELTGGTITSTRLFVWCGAERCEEHNASNSVTKRFFAQGEQINGQSYYYLKDHLGSIRELTDSTGAIKAEYSYDFWGRPTLVQGTNLADFQYAGMFAHQSSGLNLTLFRAYDPGTGRWLSRDPLRNSETSDGPDVYEYCKDNPITHTDPMGLAGEPSPGASASCCSGYDPFLNSKCTDDSGKEVPDLHC
jgi:RHS repeat-associated protein